MSQNISSELLLVLTTFPNLEEAQAMARQLLENRLAACVQIQEGIYSIYRWEDKICEEREVLLSAKQLQVVGLR